MSVWRAAALAALAAAAGYWGTLGHGFVWDDHIHVEAAPFVQDPGNARVLLTPGFWTGSTEVEGSGRPVLLATLLADRAAWGANPAGYHLTNVLVHAGAAAAFAVLAAAWLGTPLAGAAAGALFALHPVQSEAVCLVSFRADLLAALFAFLALGARRRALAGPFAPWMAASAAAFALSLLSKESAAVLPALAWLEDRLVPVPGADERRPRKALLTLALLAAVLAAYGAFRAPRGGYRSMSTTPQTSIEPPAPTKATVHLDPSPPPWREAMRSPATRARTMAGVFLDYARLVLWPSGLQADRSAPIVERWGSPRFWGGAAALLLVAGAAWGLRRRSPAAAFGAAWFLVALAPVSGVVPLHNLVAERYLYLALAGPALAAAAALRAAASRAPRPEYALAIAAAALCAACLAGTLRRVPAWRDDASLFGGALETDSARVRYNRARLAREEGKLEEARQEYGKALELNPESVESLVNMAELARAQGRLGEELSLLQRAVAVNPRSSLAREALGVAQARQGRSAAALAAFKKAVDLDSRSASARRRHAEALGWAGRFEEARREADVAVRLSPNAESHYARGRIEQDAGRLEAAIADFQEAVRLDAEHGLSWANLGVCLHQSGRLKEAHGAMLSAARLLPNKPDVQRNLGALLDELGRLDEAEAAYAKATEIDPGSAQAWHGYGVVLQKLGLAQRAREAYEKALRVEPYKVESLGNLALLCLREGKTEEARGLIQRALTARPDDPTLLRLADELARAREGAESAN